MAIEGADLFTAGNVGIGSNPPQAELHVVGDTRIDGGMTSKARYQRNDESETAYGLSPRYHLSLTAETYDGTTKVIPDQTLKDLCGDADGCEVRLGMTRWQSGDEIQTASRSFVFYYSISDGIWRSSSDMEGKVNNKKTEHAAHIWETCYFTDGTYSKRQDQGDKGTGMALLVWHNGKTADGRKFDNAKRTCELTLID